MEEAPSSSGGILPVADFGRVPFDLGTVNAGQNPALSATQAILLQDPNGQVAAPSVPDTDTDGFVDYFGASTLNQAAPSS